MRNDKRLRRLLSEASSDMLLVVYNGAMRGLPLAWLAWELRNTALKHLAKPIYQGSIGGKKETQEAYKEVTNDSSLGFLLGAYLVYLAFAKKARKVAFAHTDIDTRRTMMYKLLKKEKPFERAKSEMSEEIRDTNAKAVQYELDTAYASTIFFLISSHSDCARDHEEYQGRIYVNEGWRDLVEDDALAKRVEAFLARRHIQTMQWVTEKPVYMITRPYCRHTYRKISANEAMTFTEEELLKKYHMSYDVGGRGANQTMGAKKASYEKYRERLECLKRLYKENPTEELARDIEKTKFLMEKYASV